MIIQRSAFLNGLWLVITGHFYYFASHLYSYSPLNAIYFVDELCLEKLLKYLYVKSPLRQETLQ